MSNRSNAKAAGGLIAAVMMLFVFSAIAAFQAIRWFFSAIIGAFGSDLVARSKARRELAALAVAGVGIASAITIAAIQTRTTWHARYAEYSGVTLPAAAALAGAAAIFAWAQLSGGGRPLRWARASAFALAYGGAISVALVARYDSPTLAFARDALARRDFEAATITAQTLIDDYPRQASAAAVLLDDVLDARIAAAPTLAAAGDIIVEPWAADARRQAASRAWLAQYDRSAATAFASRSASELANLSAVAARVNPARAAETRALSELVRRSRAIPATAQDCDTVLLQGGNATLAGEYRTRVREETQRSYAAARSANARSAHWMELLALASCSSQLGDAPPVALTTIQEQITARVRREAIENARSVARDRIAADTSDESGDSGGGYSSGTYVRGYYRRGRYVRGYYRRR